jgi:hypothetical protein
MHLSLSRNLPDTVTTLAVSGFSTLKDANAALRQPWAAVADSSGNFFIADSPAHTIRKITPSGNVTDRGDNLIQKITPAAMHRRL